MDISVAINAALVVISIILIIVTIIPSLRHTGNREIVGYLQQNIALITKEKDALVKEKEELLLRITRLEKRVADLERYLEMKVAENTQQRQEIGLLSKYLQGTDLSAKDALNDAHQNNIRKRILLISSSPSNAPALNTDVEMRAIGNILKRSDYDLRIVVAATRSEITDAILEFKPTIIHFSGHGVNGDIVIEEGDQRKIKAISLDALARLLKPHPVEGIVLNACYSAQNQKVLLAVSKWVIGMKKPITDPSAIGFSDGFYRAIALNEPITSAFEVGMANVGMENLSEMDTPVLEQRSP